MADKASFVEAAITANHHNFSVKAGSWVDADPLFSRHELDGAVAIFSGSSSDTFNTLILEEDTERKAFEIIDQARRQVFGENRFAVWSWADGQLQALPVDSSAIEENLVMSCELDSLKKIPETRTPLSVTKASEPQHIMDVATVLASVFGQSEEGFMIQSVLAGQDDTSLSKLALKYLLAYEGGRAVATGSYIINGKTAGIYDIAVLPEEQKKGIGTRMFDAVIAAARKDGAESFTLQASADGAGIYERAGFDVLGACWCLDIS